MNCFFRLFSGRNFDPQVLEALQKHLEMILGVLDENWNRKVDVHPGKVKFDQPPTRLIVNLMDDARVDLLWHGPEARDYSRAMPHVTLPAGVRLNHHYERRTNTFSGRLDALTWLNRPKAAQNG